MLCSWKDVHKNQYSLSLLSITKVSNTPLLVGYFIIASIASDEDHSTDGGNRSRNTSTNFTLFYFIIYHVSIMYIMTLVDVLLTMKAITWAGVMCLWCISWHWWVFYWPWKLLLELGWCLYYVYHGTGGCFTDRESYYLSWGGVSMMYIMALVGVLLTVKAITWAGVMWFGLEWRWITCSDSGVDVVSWKHNGKPVCSKALI